MSRSAFSRFPPRLQQAIVSRLHWTSLRPVQELASHAIMDGRNVVVLAPTAGGKTEAALFPVLAGLIEDEPESVGAIYLAPIKALLNNQEERLGTYAEMVGLRRFLWHGDVTASDKGRFLKDPAPLLMTTPESLEVMLLSPRVPHARLFERLRYFIVDEVHALAGNDRGTHLLSVLERLARLTTHDVQRIGLSATVGNPGEILEWLQGSSTRPGAVIDPPRERASREVHVCERGGELAIAHEAAARAAGRKSLFFCQSRALAEHLAQRMRDGGVDVFVHHSSVSLEERQAAEERFHRGRNACIVCTSTLELGIDVGDLDLVFQANAPSTVSAFLQRMGRTGRRPGTRANTTFFCDEPEAVLQAAAIVELARSAWVEPVRLTKRAWPVLVHQLLAMTLEFGAVSAERCWEQLSRVPDFSGVPRAEFDALVTHMREQEYLFESGGLLSMGEKAEKVYGRKNFAELYAVFSSPVLFTVVTKGGHPVGSLEQAFVDTLVPELSSFLLGGRAWTVLEMNHADRVVRVQPAPRGKKPSWGGFIPQLLGFELCQQMKALLVSSEPLPYLEGGAHASLSQLRRDVGGSLRPSGWSFQVDADDPRLTWWTFAGGRINHTLKLGLSILLGGEPHIVADNFKIRLEGSPVSTRRLEEVLFELGLPDFWYHPKRAPQLLAMLPEYRLSKFQRALPPEWSVEMVGSYLLDIAGTIALLQPPS